MISRQEFTQFFWESLKDNEYVWLNPAISLEDEEVVPEILIAPKSVKKLLPQIRQHFDVGACRASFRYQNTFAVFSFPEWNYPIKFVHKMVSKNLYFLEEEAVFRQKVKSSEGIYIPCVEHVFEYAILKNFLNKKGVDDMEYAFFKDYHILVQEDLLEFFNEKYKTQFANLYQITGYSPIVKSYIISVLRELPINRLTKVVNIHWHNFLGSVRKEARMI